MSPRLRTEAALELALALVAEASAFVTDPAEQKRLLTVLHGTAVRVIERFDEMAARERSRLGHPSDN